MLRLRLASIALILGVVAVPGSAQQSPDQAQPSTYVPPAPPPFPPMPNSRPSHRWVDSSGHHSSRPQHHATKAKHHTAKPSKHSTKSRHETTKSRRHKAGSRHHGEKAHATKVHLSPRTIRKCHGMDYRQIMKHKYCRALMKQEISSEDSKHARVSGRHGHKAKSHHRAKKHHRR